MNKKILITGGTGTIGRSFIKEYPGYQYHSISRNETLITKMKHDYPEVKNHIGSIEDREFIIRTFKKVKPDIVIHAAAIKHINIAELNPIQTCRVNINGSLNIIEASVLANVPITIGISTDKACSSMSLYGYTKLLMEKCFMEANTESNRFAVARFANVAHSNGSVLPFWLNLKSKGEPLRLTDPAMNRLIFSQSKAVQLIHRTIDLCKDEGGAFVGVYKMKTVNLLALAKVISEDIVIVGLRPGEKIDEELISEAELPYTSVYDDLVVIGPEKNKNSNSLKTPISSATAPPMTVEELKLLIFGDEGSDND